MPTGRDASLVCSMLGNVGIFAESCADLPNLEEKIAEGAGAVLLAGEAFKKDTLEYLSKLFSDQPVWSDLPIVLFAAGNQNAIGLLEVVGTRFNATIVERPIRVTMLISAVRGALRAREKQYQTRDLLNRLEEADQQKDLFLATLSHELRTPLNSILGWIQLLRKEPQNQDHQTHALEVIERNAKAQAEMVADILFVSRVITGKLKLNSQPIAFAPVIQSAIDTILPSIEAKNIELRQTIISDVKINGDFDRLQQVFWNLLSNAVKFTPSGGWIEVKAINKDSNVEIEISDSGEGIKAEFLPFVFEHFRQADNSYTRKVGGLGLGLAIVRHLVGLHDGTVSVTSEGENKGATFSVTLPTITEQKLPAIEEENHDRSFQQLETGELLKGIYVLLVEDDKDSREMLETLLKINGMKVTTASSAAQALKMLKQKRPDILISDVGMPDEDGYEFIGKVRRLSPEQGGHVPAIALTGYVSVQDQNQALEAGYQQHLSKPVDIDKLIKMLKSLVTTNKQSKQNGS